LIIKQGKAWGVTRKIYKGPINELHHISAKKGGYCSEHRHRKFNLFYVLSGLLEITIFRKDGLEDVTTLGPEQTSTVPPLVWHKFKALKDTESIELYYVLLEDSDIERRIQGGQEK